MFKPPRGQWVNHWIHPFQYIMTAWVSSTPFSTPHPPPMNAAFAMDQVNATQRPTAEVDVDVYDLSGEEARYPEDGPLLEFTTALHRYGTPVIIVIGVSTNLLSLAVFVCTRLRSQSSSVYLAALAGSDSVFLLATLFSWLSWVGVNVVHETYLCHAVIYLTYLSAYLSVAIVVAFTVERYIVVCHPLKRQQICTVQRARIVLLIETIVGLLLYSYNIWTTEIQEIGGSYMCTQKYHFARLTRIMAFVDIVITFILPSVIIIILNTWITITIYLFLKRRWMYENGAVDCSQSGIPTASVRSLRFGSSTSSSHSSGQPAASARHSHVTFTTSGTVTRAASRGRQMSTTRMLLVVSGVFVLLNLPSHALRFHRMLLQYFNKHSPSQLELRIGELLEVLYYINFATNFFIYALCTRSFRVATCRMMATIMFNIRRQCLNCYSNLHRCCSRANRSTMTEMEDMRNEIYMKSSAV